MKTWITTIVAALVVASPALALECPADSYPLFCRGSLNFKMRGVSTGGGNIEVKFGFSRGVAAGATGAALSRATCAWSDRAVGPGEPAVLEFQVTDPNAANTAPTFMWETIQRCNLDSSCRFAMCARNINRGGSVGRLLHADGDDLDIHFVP